MASGPATLRGTMTAPLRLKRRAGFKAAAKGARAGRTAFTVQAVRRTDASDPSAGDAPRVGFTVTKRVGNAVVRNRIKRRLRALSATNNDAFEPRTDYVLVARQAALGAPFDDMGRDLRAALGSVSRKLNTRES